MALPTVMTALCTCSMGLNPVPLVVTSCKTVLVENKPLATIMDNKPFVNLATFGTCKAIPTPAGPGPCTPALVMPWASGCPKVLIQNQPALSNSSKLNCSLGGIISIVNPGTVKTTIS